MGNVQNAMARLDEPLDKGTDFLAKLPRIRIIGTGGTIAGSAASETERIDYKSGCVDTDRLIEGIPNTIGLASLSIFQVSSISSQDMTEKTWLDLVRCLNEQSDDPSIDGFIVTHGTDTLEETAFFLDCVYTGEKPVILTAAMRPADAPSSDGAGNVLDSIKLVSALTGRGRRVLVSLNGYAHEPRFVAKRHTEKTAAMVSVNGGLAGEIVRGQPVLYPKTVGEVRFETQLAHFSKLPYVAIVYMYVGHDPAQIDWLVSQGVRGIVIAGHGNGNMSKQTLAALADARGQGVEVVRSTNVGSGYVSRNVEIDDDEYGFVAAMDLTPPKARIVLALSILEGSTGIDLQKKFIRPET